MDSLSEGATLKKSKSADLTSAQDPNLQDMSGETDLQALSTYLELKIPTTHFVSGDTKTKIKESPTHGDQSENQSVSKLAEPGTPKVESPPDPEDLKILASTYIESGDPKDSRVSPEVVPKLQAPLSQTQAEPESQISPEDPKLPNSPEPRPQMSPEDPGAVNDSHESQSQVPPEGQKLQTPPTCDDPSLPTHFEIEDLSTYIESWDLQAAPLESQDPQLKIPQNDPPESESGGPKLQAPPAPLKSEGKAAPVRSKLEEFVDKHQSLEWDVGNVFSYATMTSTKAAPAVTCTGASTKPAPPEKTTTRPDSPLASSLSHLEFESRFESGNLRKAIQVVIGSTSALN